MKSKLVKNALQFRSPAKNLVWLISNLFLATSLIFLTTEKARANPQGGVVTGGNATISTPSPNTMQINQTTEKAIINWQTYNIGAQEHVHYQQPNSGSISLNRINPANGGSQIFGKLTANGQVWLMNPAGIWFGPGSYVNVSGLIATTGNMTDQDFLAGRYIFTQQPGWNGAIINEGIIKTHEAGLVALVGAGVVNNGHIEANMGTVVLGTGSEFTVNFSGNDLVSFTVDKGILQPAHDQYGRELSDGVRNTGKIVANGGKILVTAHTAGKILDNAINMQGIAQANAVAVKNGEIILLAQGPGRVKVSGTLLASGRRPKEKGGKVKVLGEEVVLAQAAKIDASGDVGGGEILIGGDYQGKNPSIPNAFYTFIDNGVMINADAITSGNGGKVIAWADKNTFFYGNISARGGALGGGGGFVETSGKEGLDVRDATIEVDAPNGLIGTWLLDPKNITVITGGTATRTQVDQFSDSPTSSLTISPTTLNANANVVLQANNDITISSAINQTAGNNRDLTLEAGRSILVNANIAAEGTITLVANETTANGVINANRDSGAAVITMAPGISINSLNEDVALTLNTGAGLTNSTSGNITLGGITTGGSGNVLIRNLGPTAGSSIVQANASQLITANSVGIDVNGAGGGGSIGTLVNPIRTTVNHLDARAGTGGIFLAPTVGLNIGSASLGSLTGISTLGNLSIAAAGALTQTEPFAVSGASSFSTIASPITFTNATNNFIGAVSLANTGTNDINLRDANALIIGTSSIGRNLTLTAGGSISQTGAITATGGLTTLGLTAANSDILLDTQANNFGSNAIIFNNTSPAVRTNIRDVALRNINALAAVTSFTGLTSLRNLTLTYNNAAINLPTLVLTNSGNLSVTAGGLLNQTGTLTVPGTSTFNAGINIIALTNANLLTGAVSLNTTGTNNANLNNDIPLSFSISNVGGKLTATANGSITLNGVLSATGIELASQTFINNAGALALNPGTGRFLVWSTNPASDTRGGLAYNFKQYNATYGVSTVLGSGNGFLYSIAPTITPSLIGVVSKSYDGTPIATLNSGNYATSGVIDGDTVILNNPIGGVYNNKNVGTNKHVSVTGIEIANASNGAATVYGYALSSTTANANIGQITPALLTVSSNANQNKIYGNDDPNSAKTAYSVTSGSLFGADTLNGDMGRIAGETVGSYNFLKNTVAINDGNSGNNYTLTFNGSNNPFQITTRPLTGTIANQNKVYGANDPAIGIIPVILTNVVNANVTDINGNVTVINNTGHVATTLASLTRNVGENVGNYSITAANFNALTGSANGNYNAPSFTGSPILTINKANLTGSIANQVKVYGENDPALAGIGVSLGGVINNPAIVTWNGNASINDTGHVATTLASLTRNVGENVGNYSITAANFNALTGSASGNYNSPSFTGSPILTINKAQANVTPNSASKIYGTLDPAFTYQVTGLVDSDVTNWMGDVTTIDDNLTGKLSREPGQNVGSYLITQGTLAANANYNLVFINNDASLVINPAVLTAYGVIANNKIYNGNTLASLNLNYAQLHTVLPGDNVGINPAGYEANFVSSHAGNHIPVIVNNLSLIGTSAGNYVLTQPTGLSANIFPSINPNPAPIPVNNTIPNIAVIIQQSLDDNLNILILAPNDDVIENIDNLIANPFNDEALCIQQDEANQLIIKACSSTK